MITVRRSRGWTGHRNRLYYDVLKDGLLHYQDVYYTNLGNVIDEAIGDLEKIMELTDKEDYLES